MDADNDTDPELVVQRQLDAYNARDIDTFMQWWADDCLYYEFPNHLLANGAADIRDRHVARFKEQNLHGHLIKRISIANLVVDQETVTRTFPEGTGEIDVVAIYEVEMGRIAKAWFKMGKPRLHVTSPIIVLSETVVVAVENPAQEEVAALLGQSDAVAAQLYPGEYRRPITPGTLVKAGIRVVVARKAGLAVGLCAVFKRDDSAVELKRMIVDEGSRGQGVGAALLRGAEAEAGRFGAHVVLLEVGVHNTDAQSLYRRAGYTPREPFPPYQPSPISLFLERYL